MGVRLRAPFFCDICLLWARIGLTVVINCSQTLYFLRFLFRIILIIAVADL